MNCDKTMRIMIVNEEKKCLEAERELFYGVVPDAEIVCTDSPVKALELAEKETFDVIITEAMMEQMHGMILARKIFQKKRRTNIIFFADTKEYALDAIRMFVSDYLLKPVSKERLRLSLKNLRYPVGGHRADGNRGRGTAAPILKSMIR